MRRIIQIQNPLLAPDGRGGGPSSKSREAELWRAKKYLKEKGLNQFGDKADTHYAGGTPLFDERTGKARDHLDYLRDKYKDTPWNETGNVSPAKR